MAEKEKEKETTTEIAEVETEELEGWKISDYVDSWAAQHDFKAYVYTMKQGSRTVVGLTARAYEHMSLDPRRPVTIIDETEETVTLNGIEGVLTRVTVGVNVIVPACEEVDTEGNVTVLPERVEQIIRNGKNFTPFVAFGKTDEFAFQKSSTKAFRNAVAKVVPITEQEKAKQELLALQGGKPVEVPAGAILKNTQTKPPAQKQDNKVKTGDSSTDKARKYCFAKLSEIQDKLFGVIPESDFWNGVCEHFELTTRKDFTESHWKRVTKALSDSVEKQAWTGLVNIVINKYKSDNTETETETESDAE